MVCVDIVIGTYNGARYLQEQIRSVLSQTHTHWNLYIRDDSSQDETAVVIDRLAFDEPRIHVVRDGLGNLGVIGNFNCLLENARSDYVFLCDQDDVWNADKIELSLKRMQDLESLHGRDMPILVHTDLVMVDQELRVLSNSFFAFRNLNSQTTGLVSLFAQNIVTGCTVVVNRALLVKAMPIPLTAAMHDSWLALVAAAFGEVGFVDRPTMLYRQHDANTLGAKGWSFKFILSRMKRFRSRRYAAAFLLPLIRQAKAFYERFQKELPKPMACATSTLSNFDQIHGVRRVLEAKKMDLKKHGWQRTVGFYWALLIARF
jgi:glycosyltransferase involved in cell wall biosynthesis